MLPASFLMTRLNLSSEIISNRAFGAKCKVFHFERFVALIEALADVVEGKSEYDALPSRIQGVL